MLPAAFLLHRTPWCLALLAFGTMLADQAKAQVIPDGTLELESIVTPVDALTDEIHGGTLLEGGNLFHSFVQFSIGEGRRVDFINSAEVERVFSRVTGELPSEIFGTLGSTGSADIFFLNPNGILFGPNARLDIGGSFVASTADAIEFGDIGSFSARSPEAPLSMLTVQPSAFLFGQNVSALAPGPITAQSTVDGGGFRVPNGESLVLLGGNVTVEGGELSAYGGRIEVGAVAGAGTVELEPDGQLVFAADTLRGDVAFESGAFASVRLDDGGGIGVTARNIDVAGSTLLAGIRLTSSTADSQAGDLVLNATERVRLTDGSGVRNIIGPDANGGNAGNIVVVTPVLEVLEDSQLSASTFGLGNGGQVIVEASGNVLVDGDASFIASQVNSGATGDSGGLDITTRNLSILDGAEVAASTFSEGNAGQVVVEASGDVLVDGDSSFIASQVNSGATGDSGGVAITTGNLEVSGGAAVSASTLGEGNAGQVVVEASSNVLVDGDRSFITSTVDSEAKGNSGGVTITTNNLEIRNDAEVRADTLGTGNAGQVVIDASGNILVENDGSFIASRVRTGATGTSGGIAIITGNLSVFDDAEVSASAFSEGNAGQVVIKASGDVLVDGNSSFIASQVNSGATGDSGGVDITTGNLEVSGGAAVSASTLGEGNAGQVAVEASGDVLVDGNGSFITSTVTSEAKGNSGGVTITTNNLEVLNDAEVRADTFGTGNAGTVVVNARGNVLVDGNNSFISSWVDSDAIGDSGGVNITTDGGLSVSNGASVSANTLGKGDAGQVVVQANGDVLVDGDGSFIDSQVDEGATGNSGGIVITANNLSILNAAEVTASTDGIGNSGQVEIEADGTILVQGTDSELASRVRNDGQGSSEGIIITTNALTVRDGAKVSASTSGAGDSGQVQIAAEGDITVEGDDSFVSSQVNSSASGNSGGVDIATGNLLVSDGASVSATTLGEGNAGQVVIDASGDVVVDGVDSFIASQVTSGAAGDSGGVDISTGNLSVSDGALVSASTFSEGNAGQVVIDASGDIVVEGDGTFIDSRVRADATGNSGGVGITTNNFEVRNAAQVSASTSAEGDAGRVVIDATGNVLVDSADSFITSAVSSGATGNSGGIDISTSNLLVLNDAIVSASTFSVGNAGKVEVIASNDVLVDGANSFIASTVGENALGDSGGIDITTDNLSVLNDASVSASTFGEGDAGQIVIDARENIVVDGVDSFIGSQVTSEATGDSGGINITTGNLEVLSDASVSASTFGEGDAGQIVIDARENIVVDGVDSFIGSQVTSEATGDSGGIDITTGSLEVLNDASVSATTFGTGDSGQVVARASEKVIVNGANSFIASQVGSGAEGNSGGVSIFTPSLAVLNNAEVSASTFGGGDAGPVAIVTNDITLSTDNSLISAETESSGRGGGIQLSSPRALTISGPGKLIVESSTEGTTGNIDIAAQELRLADGVTLSAATTGPADAGDIALTLTDTLTIESSTVTSSTGGGSTGDGGNITVNAGTTTLRSGGSITVDSQGAGRGGEVTVAGDQLILRDSSRISAETLSSDGGNLTFNLQEALVLREGSEITTEAGTASAGGDGGDIAINTQFIVAVSPENSDIVANAFDGNGGNVNITASGGIFGIAPRPFRTPLSDITASSQNGVSGIITVQTPDIDPTESLAELPVTFAAPELARSCRETFVQTGSSFTVSGRGGIPQGPLDLPIAPLWQDLLPILTGDGPDEAAMDVVAAPVTTAVSAPFVEAQSFMRGPDNEIVLLAATPQPAVAGKPVECPHRND